MFMLLFLFGLALGAETRSDEVKLQRGDCPPFWFSFNGRCYKYIATDMTWADAELYCVSQGANLVSIHSLDEQNFIRTLIKNFDPAQGDTWIGLSDTQKEGGWMWSDGSAVDFRFWYPGQPDNDRGQEDCGHTNCGTEKKWNDYPCSFVLPFICAARTVCP